MSDNDELAVIDGIKPNVYLQDGVEQDVKSASRRVSSILQGSKAFTYIVVQFFHI
jgi:hypothetical protein